jgi:hypothetical protein
MAIFLFSNIIFPTNYSTENGHMLAPEPQIKKLDFRFGAEIWTLSEFPTLFCQRAVVESRKWPYLSPLASNQTTEGTFSFSFFKVGEKKVSSFLLQGYWCGV